MTLRITLAREAFEAKAGNRAKMHGATHTWDSLPNSQRELAFEISLDGARPRLHVIALAGSADIVDAAADWGARLRAALPMLSRLTA